MGEARRGCEQPLRVMGRAADVEAMRELGRALAPLLKQGDTVILSGDLGAGKTQFSQGVAEGLGVGTAAVSPTFNIVLSYEDGRIPLRHLDLYRLEQSSELDDLGYGELVGQTLTAWRWWNGAGVSRRRCLTTSSK